METKNKYLFAELYTVNQKTFTKIQAFLTKVNVGDFQGVISTMKTQRYKYTVISVSIQSREQKEESLTSKGICT